MMNKIWGLIKYRVFDLPVENFYVIIFMFGVSIIMAVLGLPIASTMLFLYMFPSMVSYNGLEVQDKKMNKMILTMPISRRTNVAYRFGITIFFQIIGIIIAYLFYVSTSFFIGLGWGEVVWGFDLGGLNWLLMPTSFITIALFAVGFSLLDRGLYFLLSYTIFKKAGKPPFWFGMVVFMLVGAFAGSMGGDVSLATRFGLGNYMQLAMFIIGVAVFAISYFLSVRAFKKLDFS